MTFDHLIFDAEHLDVQSARQALADFNCIQVRRAIAPDMLREIYARMRRTALRSGGGAIPPYGMLYPMLEDPEQSDFPLVRLLARDPIFAVISSHFDAKEFLLTTHHASVIRRVVPTRPDGRIDTQAEPFHQDSRCCDPNYWGPMIIVWFHMIPERLHSDLAPALKLVPGPVREVLPTGDDPTHPHNRDLEISGSRIGELARRNGGIWIPELELGDAVIFTGMCPHSTHLAPTMNEMRISCELKVWPNGPIIHDGFLAMCQVNNGHIVIGKNFIVGPTTVKQRAEDIFSVDSPAFAGAHDYADWKFSYGRVQDDRVYAVRNAVGAAAGHVESSKGNIVFCDVPGHPSRHFVELLQPKYTGRALKRAPWTPSSESGAHGDEIIFGSFAFGLHEQLEIAPIYLASLRNSISRAISEIWPTLKTSSMEEFSAYLDSVGSLSTLPDYFARHYADLPWFPRDSLANGPKEMDEAQKREAAWRNLREFFPFICIHERFSESAFILFDRLGWPATALPVTGPVTPTVPLARDLPDALLRKLESKLQADLEIYDFYVKRLDELMANADFGAALRDFDRDLADLSRVLARTFKTIARHEASKKPSPATLDAERFDYYEREVRALRQRLRSTDLLQEAQELKLQAQAEQIERMQASYTNLLRAHLESQNIVVPPQADAAE